jgi:hypothetical protein
MYFNGKIVVFGVLGGDFCRCFAHSRANFEDYSRFSTKNGLKVDKLMRKWHSEARHEHFVGTLLAWRKASLAQDKAAYRSGCCVHAAILAARILLPGFSLTPPGNVLNITVCPDCSHR